MADQSTNAYIGVISGLLVILLIITVLLAVFVWFKSKYSARSRIKRKKPRLKLNIKDVPKTMPHPPSAAYQILSSHDPPEFTIPPTPTLSTPGSPDLPRFQLKPMSLASAAGRQGEDVVGSPGGSPNISPNITPRNSLSAPVDPLYRRSASVPNDVFFDSANTSSSSLWRSAISKTVAANLLSVPLRNRKVMHATNGAIKFCLKYNLPMMELFVKVLDLIDLPLTREKGVSYPYVQVYIYANDEKSQPLFYEVLNYTREKTCDFIGLTVEKIRSSILKFVVLDYDKFSRTEFVADVVLPLEHVNIDGDEELRHLNVVMDPSAKDRGELLVSLCYQPNSSQVSVIVLKATGLPEGAGGSRPDYFVKITLLRNGVINDKRRTRPVKKTRCPVFNEKLVFPVDEHGLRSICLVFDVMHHESRLKQEKTGSVVIGNQYAQRTISPLELQHFHEMLESPQKQIAEWHKIL